MRPDGSQVVFASGINDKLEAWVIENFLSSLSARRQCCCFSLSPPLLRSLWDLYVYMPAPEEIPPRQPS